MMFQYKITLFTPTYNRAYILEKLYRSIQRQTYHDFEWLVVDDGSTDNTEELVRSWMKEDNFFPIRYYKKKTAANAGQSTMRWIWQRVSCFSLWIPMTI